MAKNVIINQITYQNVPAVDIPKTDGGEARFVDTSDATLVSGNQLLTGVSAYSDGVKISGTIPIKMAQRYVPSTTDQVIACGSYLNEDQTIAGDSNLVPQNIAGGVTIFGVQGSLSTPTITQDSVTKVLSII